VIRQLISKYKIESSTAITFAILIIMRFYFEINWISNSLLLTTGGLPFLITLILRVLTKNLTPHIDIELCDYRVPDGKKLILHRKIPTGNSSILKLTVSVRPTKFFGFITKKLKKDSIELNYYISISHPIIRYIEEKNDGKIDIEIIDDYKIKIALTPFLVENKCSSYLLLRVFSDESSSDIVSSFNGKKDFDNMHFIHRLLYYLLRVQYSGLKNIEIKEG